MMFLDQDWMEKAYQKNPGVKQTIESDQDAQRILREAIGGNLLRTITSIPSHKEHLINPILLVLRENENLNDDLLWQPKADLKNYSRFEEINWGHSGNPTTYKNLQHFLNKGELIYVFHLPSLRALPLFKVTNLRVIYGFFDHSAQKGVPRILNQSNYADIGRLLDLNQLISFDLTPNYDHEPDDILTIQPFAHALSRQKALKNFTLPRFIGVSNFEYLLMNGIVPNQSINSLSYRQIYGELPIALMGKMLAKNKTVTSLVMYCEKLRDLECLNELGRGLEQNTTLREFTLSIESITASLVTNPLYVKPLSGRNSNTHFVCLDPLKRALILYKGVLVLEKDYFYHNEATVYFFDSINLEREQEKLKIQQQEKELEKQKQLQLIIEKERLEKEAAEKEREKLRIQQQEKELREAKQHQEELEKQKQLQLIIEKERLEKEAAEKEQEKLRIQQQEKELREAKQHQEELEKQKQQKTQLMTALDGYRKLQNPISYLISLIEKDTGTTSFIIVNKDNETESDLFGVEFFRPFSFSMLFNSHITNLQITNFYLGDDEIILLSEMIRRNKVLMSIEFQHNLIGDKGAIALGEALGLNPGFKILQLQQNQIGDEGAVALAQGLGNNSNLQILYVAGNKIKDDGVIAFGKILKVNLTLQELNLSANQIKDDGAISLGQALKLNSVLRTLDISSNQIGDDGAIGIGQGLKLNYNLKLLNLASNKIKNDGAMGIRQAMKLNETLQRLNLIANQIDSEGVRILNEILGIKGMEMNLDFIKTDEGWKSHKNIIY